MPTHMPPKRTIAIIVTSILVVIAVIVGGFAAWALTPLGPSQEALDALAGDVDISVAETEYGWVFSPKDAAPITGVIFYPGGRVDPRSYAQFAHDLALNGHLVVIVPMRLNLAVLSPNRAEEVIAANPGIEAWAISGHSLGGTMAAQYAKGDLEHIEALALLASYPADSTDLSTSDIKVISLYGTLDGVLSEDSFKSALPLLPKTTEYLPIEGGNHAQFGSYGSQPGDNPATIDAQTQLDATVRAVALMMRPIRLPLLR